MCYFKLEDVSYKYPLEDRGRTVILQSKGLTERKRRAPQVPNRL